MCPLSTDPLSTDTLSTDTQADTPSPDPVETLRKLARVRQISAELWLKYPLQCGTLMTELHEYAVEEAERVQESVRVL